MDKSSYHLLNGQIEIVPSAGELEGTGSAVVLHAGRHTGASFKFADVKFVEDQDGGNLVLRFTWTPLNERCSETYDFKNYIGKILHYLMLVSTGVSLIGTGFEDFELD